MRKYRSYIVLLTILIAVAIYFWVSDKSGTMRVQSNYFAVSDTSIVSNIQIINNSDTLLLSKLNNNWVVNEKYNARSNLVKQLLGMVSLIEISSPVPKRLRNIMISNYINQPLEISFFEGLQLIKKLRIVESDSLLRGSVMFTPIENDPYLVKIPGFDGRISMLFPTNQMLYRDKTIFRYQPFEILYIKIDYPGIPNKSFMLNMSNPSDMKIQSPVSGTLKGISKENAIRYAMHFASVPFEFLQSVKSTGIADSLKFSTPYCIIEVKNISNQITRVFTYPIAVQGKNKKNDLFKMYAVIQNDSLPLIVKYTDFDPIMKDYDGFPEP